MIKDGVAVKTTKGSLARSSLAIIQDIFKNYLVVVAIVLLVVVTVIEEPRFLTLQNLNNIISQLGGLSILALGMTIAIIGGYVDLTVVGTINLTAIVTISLIEPFGQVAALLIGLCLGPVLGFINSRIIISAGANTLFEALFITFGLSSMYSALALIISNGETINLRYVDADSSLFDLIGSKTIGFMTIPFVIFLVFIVILHIFHSKTYWGRSISLTGANKTAADLAGIPVNKSITTIFVISGLMAALTGIILFSRVTKASPVIGNGYDLNAILAVVVGGTPLKGGKGSVLRTFLGVMLITLLANCLDLLGVSPYAKLVLSGSILVVAIWLDNRKELRGEYK